MDFLNNDMFSKYLDKAAIEFLSCLAPDEETRNMFKKCLTVFVNHGIRVTEAMDILIDLVKVVEPKKSEDDAKVSVVSIDSLRMAYNILHTAYGQTKATKDELKEYIHKAVNTLNPKNRKEKSAALILNMALSNSKITKKELRTAIKEAAEELCK